jgi:2-oxoisovalerate dehydrogenase E1 component
MPEWHKVDILPELKRFVVGEKDYLAVPIRVHLCMLELVYLIRAFENTLLDLKDADALNGPVHTSVGQEAVAAGCGLALGRKDIVGSTHRAHHHFLGKVLPFYYPGGYDPSDEEFSEEMEVCVERTMSEIMGLKRGWCGGRGGSMHLRHPEAGVIGTNAIVGGGVALTTGAGWAQKLRKTGCVAVAFLGDGAVNQGILLESANLAKLWRIPVTFFVENNLYAVGTGTTESSSTDDLAQRGLGFGMDGLIVDGMDPLAVYLIMREVRDAQSAGSGPRFVEAKTYRYYHHAGKQPGSKLGYRSCEEEDSWRCRDPHSAYPRALKTLGLLTDEIDAALSEKVKGVVSRAAAKVTEKKDGKLRIPERLWPDSASVSHGVPVPVSVSHAVPEPAPMPRSAQASAPMPYGAPTPAPVSHAIPHPADAHGEVRYSEREDFTEFTSLTFVNVMSQVAARNMEKDPSVVVMGEEVANLGGGAYNATRFPLKAFPERVFNTPISEAGFTGIAFGAALSGVKPIVEIMFPDFALVAADQLFNQIAKLKYLYGGGVEVPLVVRTRIAMGLGYGAQHSSDPGGLFAMFRGWRIVAPSNPFDYVGLFNTAVRSKDPVLVVEHHSLYKEKGEVPLGNMDYFIPFGKARRFREGDRVTVVTYLKGVALIDAVASGLKESGVGVDAIDLRCLDYASIDYETIGRSLRKTGLLAVLEEAPLSMGIGARIACEAQERFWKLLKGPVCTINSLDYPLPVSKRMEEVILLNEAKVRERLLAFAAGKKALAE